MAGRVAPAVAVPLGKCATKHQPSEPAELLFVRGFAGENADYGFGVRQTNGSGYFSHEKARTGHAQIFVVFWEPENTAYSQETSAEDRGNVKFEGACGPGMPTEVTVEFRYHCRIGVCDRIYK